jgi:RNA polymerase sigma-70 factor (ECF subfamily)
MALDDSTARTHAEWLLQAASGDARAAQDLAGALAPRLFAQAFRMLGDRAEAEDVAQDTLLRLWRMAPRWDEDGSASVAGWCHAVARNLCIDRMRRRGGARATLPLDDVTAPEDPKPGAEAQMQTAARARALHAALRDLPDRQRHAVVLRHMEGLANPDIAERIGGSVEAVESLIARGKRALAKALAGRRAELGFEDDQT